MSASNLLARAARLLVERGLISVADIHDCGLRVRDVSQSNGVALAECGDGRAYIVKSVSPLQDDQQGSSTRELALYQTAASAPQTRAFIPEFHFYDDGAEVMVLEGLVTSRRLDQIDGGRGPLDPDVAGWLGTALGAWHRNSAQLKDSLDHSDPWMLHIDGPQRLEILNSDEEISRVVRKILEREQTAAVPARVRIAWHADTVIHGDVRFANILVQRSAAKLRFVDWETSGVGDPAWDIGGAVQEYLSFGLGSGQSDMMAVSPLTTPIAAMLSAYRSAAEQTVPWAHLAPFVACRLLMRAIQLANWKTEAGDSIDLHLELAGRMADGAVKPQWCS